VQIVDEESRALGGASVKALIAPPGGDPASRTRLTKPSGCARLHWGCGRCADT
jgi:hypothetical protein